MAQTSINIHMNEGLKKQFDAFCSDTGVSVSIAFCVFVRTAVGEWRIPFEISTEKDPFHSAANITRLKKSTAEMETTGSTAHGVEFDD